MKKLIITAVIIVLISSPTFAATYYMANNPCSGNPGWGNGSDSNNGAKATPWLTLDHAFDIMTADDVLIIDDGVYTGTSNQITTTQCPPTGSGSGSFTRVIAENDGEVEFDGEDTRSMFNATNDIARYWSFEGLIWSNGTSVGTVILSSTLSHGSMVGGYIKFLRCGAYDVAAGNSANWYIRQAYTLLEGCYAWGTGRYKFLSFLSEHIVFRNCVGRHDAVNAGGEPIAGFSMYRTLYAEVQNCIVVDSDQTAHWSNYGDIQGCYFTPTTGSKSDYVAFRQCVGLNSKLGGMHSASLADNLSFRDVVIWDCDISGSTDNLINNFRCGPGGGCSAKNLTVGETSGYQSWIVGPWPSLKDSIFYNITLTDDPVDNFWSWINCADDDYNCYYGNTNNTGRTGTNDLTAINPITNALDYIVRIESSSDLDTAGSDGGEIGATVLTLIGTAETFYNDTGYATDTGNDMWPFPNEDLIKSKMQEYEWDDGGGGDPEIDGDRGFASSTALQEDGSTPVTLTSYIWEYLGNLMPSTIYGEEDTTAPTVSNIDTDDEICSSDPKDVTKTWDTDEAATCRVTTNGGTWAAGNEADSTGGTSHSTVISSLACDASYTYDILCQDASENESDPGNLDFDILAASTGSCGFSAGGSVGFSDGGGSVVFQ